jgi:hypothetical protein
MADHPPPNGNGKHFAKADNAVIAARVSEVLTLMLAGASRSDILRYSSEASKPGDPGTVRPWGLTSRQIETYMKRAHELLEEHAEKDRGRLLRLHLSQRQDLYARALHSGDVRAALAVVKDLDELLGYYPPKSVELTGEIALRHLAEKVKALSDGDLITVLGVTGATAVGAESAGSRGEATGTGNADDE